MTANYPLRLVSSEKTVDLVKSQTCNSCKLIHRINPEENLYTIGREIDPEIINFSRLCGLSLNVLICNNQSLSHICFDDDVKYSVKGENKKELAFSDFTTDSQKPQIDVIEFEYDDSIQVIGFVKSEIENILGTYPFNSKGKKGEEKEYDFNIEVIYKPTPVNVLHFEILIKGTHPTTKNKSEEFKEITGTSKKKYIESITTKIKNRIIKNNFLFEVKDHYKTVG